MPGLGIDVPTLRSGTGSTVFDTITLYGNEGTDLRSITVRLVGQFLTRITAHNNSGCSNLNFSSVEKEAFAGPDVLYQVPFALTLLGRCNKKSSLV